MDCSGLLLPGCTHCLPRPSGSPSGSPSRRTDSTDDNQSTRPAWPALLSSPGYAQLLTGCHLSVQGHLKLSTILLLSRSHQCHWVASSPIRCSGQNLTCCPWLFTSGPLTPKPSLSPIGCAPKQFLNVPPSLHLHPVISTLWPHLPPHWSPWPHLCPWHSVLPRTAGMSF